MDEAQPTSGTIEFRKDINGLRAYAVIAVVLYHFGLANFNGGFAGVDVFFVISGFLMTGIILSRLQLGKFSLIDFYISRARRILPALTVLCLVLLIAGYYWLIPSDFEMLGKHISAAMLFVSNFVFKGEAGYFDAPGRDKWLLHTWSLSVEWQFYLLYPLLLMAWAKYFNLSRQKLIRSLAVLALVTLALSVILTPTRGTFSFYHLPTRIWEFMAGALVYTLPQKPYWLRNAVKTEVCGILLIAAGFFVFTSATPWPGYAAVLPVLGTVLVIHAARQNSLLTGNAIAQTIGKWSYSIYLWHWPVCVWLGYFAIKGTGYALAGILVSLILGAISYVAVEAPVRKKMAIWPQSLALTGIATVVALIASLGLTVVNANGMPNRVSAEIRDIEFAAKNRYHECGFEKNAAVLKNCYVGEGDKTSFVVWGDSHAAAVSSAIAAAAKARGVVFATSCPTIFNAENTAKTRYHCGAFNNLVFNGIRKLPENTPVIIVSRFSHYLYDPINGINRPHGLKYSDIPQKEVERDKEGTFKRKLTETLCAIASERKLYVVKPIPEMQQSVPNTLARELMAGLPAPDISISISQYTNRHRVVLNALSEAEARCGVVLLNPVPYLCREGQCFGSLERHPLYFDSDHLNEWGNKKLVPMFAPIFTHDPAVYVPAKH